jgi:hypothetical protein
MKRGEVRVLGAARDARNVWRWIGASVFAPTRRETITHPGLQGSRFSRRLSASVATARPLGRVLVRTNMRD